MNLTMGWLAMGIMAATVAVAQKPKVDSEQQGFTGYSPSVYMNAFLACPTDSPCTRTKSFTVDPVPKDCCILLVANGDGHGTDEVRSYEVFLNGERVIPSDRSRNAQAPVKLLTKNTLKVILTGEPHSNVFVLIAYDPRKSN